MLLTHGPRRILAYRRPVDLRRSIKNLVGNIVLEVLAFILDPEVTAAILRHLRRHGRDPYAMHDERLAADGRAPP